MAARNRRGMLLAVVARKTRWSRMSMSSSSRGPRWWWMVGRSSRRRCRSPGSGTGRSYLAGGGGGGAGAGAWAEGMIKNIRTSNQGTGLTLSSSPKRFVWRGRVWEYHAVEKAQVLRRRYRKWRWWRRDSLRRDEYWATCLRRWRCERRGPLRGWL